MRDLCDVYESARINIPQRIFPERKLVPVWQELDEKIRSELGILEEKVLSVLVNDDLLLTSNQRVISEFNRGVRKGFFTEPQVPNTEVTGYEMSLGPFQWGLALGMQAKQESHPDPVLIKQFLTATHLLAYEFGQLNLALSNPYDFLIRNVGPERADEFGELVFALPILVNYRRPLIQELLDTQEFSFAGYHSTQPPVPSHLEYLDHGLIALFDPAPESWIRVAANLGLAIRPFGDGQTLLSEHFQAPMQAATTLYNKPITARTVVRRQIERIELARSWIGTQWSSIEMRDESSTPVTLWDVYQSTAAASIRGHDAYFGDLVANNVISLLSEYFEENIGVDDTRFGFMRRHLPAFTCGFDAHVENAVDFRAFVSVARGRSISDGLRRFENGGIYVGNVCKALTELGDTLNELHHALENPTSFIHSYFEVNEETPIAAQLLNLFRRYPSLSAELFSENLEYEFFSRTQIQTNSPFDLLRSMLFHVSQAVQPNHESPDEVEALLAIARRYLGRLMKLADTEPQHDQPNTPVRSPQRSVTVGKRGESKHSGSHEIFDIARRFNAEFDTLVRLFRRIVHPLYFARMLGKPNSVFNSDYLELLHLRNTTQIG